MKYILPTLKGKETFEEVLAEMNKVYPEFDTTDEESLNALRAYYEEWRNPPPYYSFYFGYVERPESNSQVNPTSVPEPIAVERPVPDWKVRAVPTGPPDATSTVVMTREPGAKFEARHIRRAEFSLQAHNVLIFPDGFYHGTIGEEAANEVLDNEPTPTDTRYFIKDGFFVHGGCRLAITKGQDGATVFGTTSNPANVLPIVLKGTPQP